MPDQTIAAPRLMTLAEKMQALTNMAAQGRESDVYSGIAYLLRERPQPTYVRAIDEILASRDWPEWLSKDRPVNMESRHAGS